MNEGPFNDPNIYEAALLMLKNMPECQEHQNGNLTAKQLHDILLVVS